MSSATMRRTLIGALVGGALFFAASLYQSLRAGGDPLRFAAPTAAMVVIGATVGALLGPLLGRIGRRGRGADEGSERAAARGPSHDAAASAEEDS